MCELEPVSRAGFYRSLQEQRPIEEEMEIRSAIPQIAVEHRRRYGRRISGGAAATWHASEPQTSARIMREGNLLPVRPRQFVVTADSNHQLEVYLNLASRVNVGRTIRIVRPNATAPIASGSISTRSQFRYARHRES